MEQLAQKNPSVRAAVHTYVLAAVQNEVISIRSLLKQIEKFRQHANPLYGDNIAAILGKVIKE